MKFWPTFRLQKWAKGGPESGPKWAKSVNTG